MDLSRIAKFLFRPESDEVHPGVTAHLKAKLAWIESATEHGDPVPEPRYRPAIYASG